MSVRVRLSLAKRLVAYRVRVLTPTDINACFARVVKRPRRQTAFVTLNRPCARREHCKAERTHHILGMIEPTHIGRDENPFADQDHILLTELESGKWWGIGSFISSASSATFTMPATMSSYDEALRWAQDTSATKDINHLYVRSRS